MSVGLWIALSGAAQTLSLPPRPADAPTGTQFTNIIVTMDAPSAADPMDQMSERERWIYAQIVSGNVPGWLRTLKPITVSASGHTATYHVIPDYLAIGSDTDYLLCPMTPLLAQRLCDRLGCTLPTRKMGNQIWTNAAVKLSPAPIAPSAEMITVPIFAQHNAMVRSQRFAVTNAQPLGALVSGDKKDVVVSTLIYSNLHTGVPKPVVIYGWHYTSGSPIQPLYNGHEQTYADYSHGIRLVQMNLTVDGGANTVTNVLTNPNLATLLNDETLAANHTIPLPRYSVAPLVPTVMVHPRSQTIAAGSNVTLQTLAMGDLPLAYRWRRFGTNLPGATNDRLVLTNVQDANTGEYSVAVSNRVGSAISRVAVVRLKSPGRPLLFADDFNTNASTRWSVFWAAANGIADYTVDWAFDYGATPVTFNGITALIPPAPNSPDGSTRALRLSVNGNDAVAATAAVNLYPKYRTFDGDFALKFDLWMHYPGDAAGAGSSGSTEHAIFGLNHHGTNANWAATSTATSDGLWFAVDGEGGTSADYRAYVGNPAGAPIDLTATLSASNNTAALYQNLFPAARFETAGAPCKNWVEVELRHTTNLVTWLLDGVVIAQRPNTSRFTNGTVMIGLMDTFSSIASPARDSFILFDNLRVEDLKPYPLRFESIERPANGPVRLAFSGVPGTSYSLEVAADVLTNWQFVATLNASNQPSTFVDTNTPSDATRFYRLRQ